MKELDEILSGQGEVAPAPEPAVETNEPAAPEQATQDGETEGTQVPLAALKEERAKSKRYTEALTDLEKKFEESNAQWERRMTQLMERLQPPQQQQQPAPDQFSDGDGWLRHGIQQHVSPQLDQVQQAIMANARMIAGVKYGDDKVEQAEQAFIKALDSRTLDPADYHRIVNAPNRYAAAAQWHARQQTLSEIGDDPAAYKERLRAELLEEMKTQQPAQQPAPVMPSNLAGARNVGNRSGPVWAGPTPLTDIFKR